MPIASQLWDAIGMKTDVHTNADGSLFVLPHFVERSFGRWRTPGVGGACLLMQLASIYHRTLGVNPTQIQNALTFYLDGPNGYFGDRGRALVPTLRIFEHLSPWKVKGCAVHSVMSAIHAVQRGVPVLLVHDRNLISEGDHSHNGTAWVNPRGRKVSMSSGYNHALLVIGYDLADNLLIVRESRQGYAQHRGMFKIRVGDLLKWQHGWRMIELLFAKDPQ